MTRLSSRHARTAVSWLGTSATSPRLVQAVKAAIAVAIAWSVAPFLPGVADDYPYYAPLGALVSMYPTLMSSVKNSLQTLGGLAVGILLAAAVLIFSEPNVLTLSLAVGAGAVIAATGWFGANREYIPVTALFVLIIGGPNADGYSIGYLEQMSLGIVIGLAVNLVVLPPLAFDAVGVQLARFRTTLADHLDEISVALKETWPPEQEDWATRNLALVELGRQVRFALLHADDSRKGNPRARFNRRNLSSDYEDLSAFETVTFHVRDLTDVLAGAVWGTPLPLELRPELRPAVAATLAAVATALKEWDSETPDPAALLAADASVEELMAELDQRRNTAPITSMAVASSVAMDVKRILAALRPRLEGPEERTDAAPEPPVRHPTRS